MKTGIRIILLLLLFGGALHNADGQPIYTYAGSGITGHTDSGGVLTLAQFNHPWGLAFDRAGNMFIADHVNSEIRKISTAGAISTYAGTTVTGHTGDSSAATAAALNRPASIVTDAAGNLYIADGQGNCIRKISASGIIYTIAGNDTAGYTGDGGPATAATFNDPTGIAMDASGNLYIADSGNNVIRKISSSGIISTFAGTGTRGYTGDGGPASAATFSGPLGVAIDGAGNIYVADNLNNVVRKINTAQTISTFAGNGTEGYTGDGGPATAAQLNTPNSMVFDASGAMLLSDQGNNAVRKIGPAGIITTIAGNGIAGYSGDGGPATSANLFKPMGLATDTAKNIYIADYINNVIRVVKTARTEVSSLRDMPAAINIYPDPADNNVTVEVRNIRGDLQVDIVNTAGQKVSRSRVYNNNVIIGVSQLPRGVYFVHCYCDDKNVGTARLVKR